MPLALDSSPHWIHPFRIVIFWWFIMMLPVLFVIHWIHSFRVVMLGWFLCFTVPNDFCWYLWLFHWIQFLRDVMFGFLMYKIPCLRAAKYTQIQTASVFVSVCHRRILTHLASRTLIPGTPIPDWGGLWHFVAEIGLGLSDLAPEPKV